MCQCFLIEITSPRNHRTHDQVLENGCFVSFRRLVLVQMLTENQVWIIFLEWKKPHGPPGDSFLCLGTATANGTKSWVSVFEGMESLMILYWKLSGLYFFISELSGSSSQLSEGKEPLSIILEPVSLSPGASMNSRKKH